MTPKGEAYLSPREMESVTAGEFAYLHLVLATKEIGSRMKCMASEYTLGPDRKASGTKEGGLMVIDLAEALPVMAILEEDAM